jgi:peptidoglycan/LPS O-acetylase OafA/YrhL
MELHRDRIAPAGDAQAIGLLDGARPLPAPAVSDAPHPPDGYVPEVDALRGLAMTTVIIFHCKLMPFGWMGVWLFYVVSGFSVATSLFGGRRRVASIGASIGSFYVRRALRIWPIYFAFVVLNVAVLLALDRTGPLEEVPWLLTFAYNLKMIFTVYTPQINWSAFGHLWTLSVEQQFYLVFPLLLLLRGRTTRGLVLLGVVALAPLIRAAVGNWVAGLDWDAERSAFAVYAFGPAHFDAFAIGTLIALFRAEIAADRRIARTVMALTGVFTAGYVGIYATFGVMQTGYLSLAAMHNIISGVLFGQGRQILVYFVPTGIGAAVLTGILSGQRHCLRACRMPGLQAIGRVSYGVYLFHIPVLMLLGAFVPVFAMPTNSLRGIAGHIGLFACAYAITVGTAWLSFTFFEQRISRLGRRRE